MGALFIGFLIGVILVKSRRRLPERVAVYDKTGRRVS
jgi:hypothetical protein